jgi:hypothetical protein
MGMGAVILDDQGRCLSGFYEHQNEVTSPELAKCLAMRRAIQFAQAESHQRIILASDCLSVVQRLADSGSDRSTMGVVVTDIKRIAASFSSCVFHHIPHGLNGAAHLLARSCENSAFVNFHDVIPDLIRQTKCTNVKL